VETLELGPQDAAALAELESQAFENAWSERDLESELRKPGALALAIKKQNVLAAAALFSTVLDEAELLRIATRPESRRQGFGKALLETGLTRLAATGILSVYLEVEEGNTAARRLYESLSFEENGRRPAYYKNGAAAVLYRRQLQPGS